jgi:fructokinase
MADALEIVGLGESLWDLLPTGKQLGGAPLNVAFHVDQLLRGRLGRGVVASRIGQDELGNAILDELKRRRMLGDYLQRDATHPTGTVQVELRDGQPTYTFADHVAWDHLEFSPAWAELATRASAICFGTLAQRSPISRETVWQFLDANRKAIRLFDVNLRPPYYEHQVLIESCRRANLVKLNEQELPLVNDLLDLSGRSPVFRLAKLRARFNLEGVIYTRGARGTMLVLDDKVISPAPATYPGLANADTVGAGDACSAGILVGWARGLAATRIVELANHCGAFVASQSGATPELPPSIIEMATA